MGKPILATWEERPPGVSVTHPSQGIGLGSGGAILDLLVPVDATQRRTTTWLSGVRKRPFKPLSLGMVCYCVIDN